MCLHQFASAHFLSQISCHFLLLECLPSPSPSCLPTFWAHLTASHQKVPCCFTLFHSVSSVIFPVNLLTFQGLLGKTGPPLPSLSVASSSKLSEVCLKLCLRASFALIVIFWIFLFCPAASTEQSCLSPGRTKLQKILTEMNVCHFFFFLWLRCRARKPLISLPVLVLPASLWPRLRGNMRSTCPVAGLCFFSKAPLFILTSQRQMDNSFKTSEK